MPSWPAASATAAISVVDAGISVDMALIASDISASSPSVRSVVLATPVMADSKSIDACTHSSKPSFISLSAAEIPAAARTLDTASTACVARLPKDSALSAVSPSSPRAFAKVVRNSRPSCASSANSISYSFRDANISASLSLAFLFSLLHFLGNQRIRGFHPLRKFAET